MLDYYVLHTSWHTRRHDRRVGRVWDFQNSQDGTPADRMEPQVDVAAIEDIDLHTLAEEREQKKNTALVCQIFSLTLGGEAGRQQGRGERKAAEGS